MLGVMQGKKGLIMGVANERSIAWSAAQEIQKAGGEYILTYPNEKFKSRIDNLSPEGDSLFNSKCDVTEQSDIKNLFKTIKEKVGKIDFIVHSLAFSDKSELGGRFIHTSKENFLNSMHISCYSLIEICNAAIEADVLNPGASIVTMSYIGSVKTVSNYNVMGVAKAALEASSRYLAVDLGKHDVRVNVVSAGAIKTLAASAINNFSRILNWTERYAPLKRNVSQAEVAKSMLYFLSDYSSGVTGEVHYVDAGYNIIGVRDVDNE